MKRGSFGLLVLALLTAASAHAQELVTPVRVGHPDAPLQLSVWAQQDYSHLAALPLDRRRLSGRVHGMGRGQSGRPARGVGDAGARAAQGQAAARGRCRPSARRRVDRQLLAAAVSRGRPSAAAQSVLAGGRSRRLSAVHDRHALRSHAATSTASGTRRTAARCSIARTSCRFRRRPGTS